MDQKQTGRPNLVGYTLLLGPTSLVNDLKDNANKSSTLEVHSQIWKFKQDALRVRNRSNMAYLIIIKYQHWKTRSTPSGCALMMMTLSKRNGK